MPCLECEGSCDDGALICDDCAEARFKEAKFFLNPVLIGPSLYARLRSQGSVACILGPTTEGDTAMLASADLRKSIHDASAEGLTEAELVSYYDLCNQTLAHMGIPLKYDASSIHLTEDAAESVLTVVTKVQEMERVHGPATLSDLNLRLGVVYWNALHGILLRTAGRAWRDGKRAYLIGRAKECLSRVSDRDELYSLALWNLSMLCSEVGDWEDARRYLSDTMAHFPDDPQVMEAMVLAELELGNPLDALSRVDDIIAQACTSNTWLLKGRILVRMGKREESLECFNQALSLDACCMDAHNHLIAALRALGKDEDAALAEQEKELRRKPELQEKILEIVSELTRAPPAPPITSGRTRPTRKMVEAQAEAAESTPTTPVDLALAALEARDYDMAIQRAQHLVDGGESSRDAQLILIEALVAKGELKEASHRAHAFYEHNRDDALAWYWRGTIAEREGKWGAAVQYFSKSVTLDPELADAWAAMGETLLSNGKLNGADESFSRALQIDADHARAWLGKGKAMRALGRWGAAIQCLDRYNSLMPNDAEAWLLKADTLFDKEKYRRAVDSYNMYIELHQADSYSLGRKGVALNALGMKGEARECLEESVRLDPRNREAANWLQSLSGGGEA